MNHPEDSPILSKLNPPAGGRLAVEIRNASDLKPANREDRQLVILAAAFIGSTRLIDNLAFDLDLPA